jgi:hypothetical protein
MARQSKKMAVEQCVYIYFWASCIHKNLIGSFYWIQQPVAFMYQATRRTTFGPIYLVCRIESVKNFGTHLLLIKVSQDYEEAEGHAVSFALGEEQAVWVATVAHVLQEVNATSKQSVRNKLLWP